MRLRHHCPSDLLVDFSGFLKERDEAVIMILFAASLLVIMLLLAVGLCKAASKNDKILERKNNDDYRISE